MIGFEENDLRSGRKAGLLSQATKSNPTRFALVLVAGACASVATVALWARPRAASGSSITFVGATTDAPCPTKPFGQCAGMNFSNADAGLEYNFSTPADDLACCPAGTACVKFGPVWGMCMPSWLGGPPAMTVLAAGKTKAEAKAEKAEKTAEKAEEKAEEAAPSSAGGACPTKPFGQCAGMNFSNADAGLEYNFSTPADDLACCPAGTACVKFGPVWGMCMPSWLGPMAGGPPAMTVLTAEEGEADAVELPENIVAAVDPCPTKPFGQCAGMNFSEPAAGSQYNFSTSAIDLACCPVGTSCVKMGPAWGMCMPSWAGPKFFSPLATTVLAAGESKAAKEEEKAEKSEEKAEEKVEKSEEKAEKEAEKAEKKAEKKAEEAAASSVGDPCPTKPFGQCAGMNFSKPHAKLDFNFSTTAADLACCPGGTTCVKFGPAWGMCMPLWLGPKNVGGPPAMAVLAVAESEGLPTAQEDALDLRENIVAAVDPCPTKPFGQCSGMNFSQPDGRLTYNFTAPAADLACCPAGTTCLKMGPAWGMCMPSWGPP